MLAEWEKGKKQREGKLKITKLLLTDIFKFLLLGDWQIDRPNNLYTRCFFVKDFSTQKINSRSINNLENRIYSKTSGKYLRTDIVNNNIRIFLMCLTYSPFTYLPIIFTSIWYIDPALLTMIMQFQPATCNTHFRLDYLNSPIPLSLNTNTNHPNVILISG